MTMIAIRLIDLLMSINDIYCSNHRKEGGREREKTSLFIRWSGHLPKKNTFFFFFLRISKSFLHFRSTKSFVYSVIDELRLVILMWCLQMYSCINIFLYRQSLRKTFIRSSKLLSAYIKSWSHHLPICEYKKCWVVKLNETARAHFFPFLSYQTLYIHSWSNAYSIITDFIFLLVKEKFWCISCISNISFFY
jgi:hypothetical protein